MTTTHREPAAHRKVSLGSRTGIATAAAALAAGIALMLIPGWIATLAGVPAEIAAGVLFLTLAGAAVVTAARKTRVGA